MLDRTCNTELKDAQPADLGLAAGGHGDKSEGQAGQPQVLSLETRYQSTCFIFNDGWVYEKTQQMFKEQHNIGYDYSVKQIK